MAPNLYDCFFRNTSSVAPFVNLTHFAGHLRHRYTLVYCQIFAWNGILLLFFLRLGLATPIYAVYYTTLNTKRLIEIV